MVITRASYCAELVSMPYYLSRLDTIIYIYKPFHCPEIKRSTSPTEQQKKAI